MLDQSMYCRLEAQNTHPNAHNLLARHFAIGILVNLLNVLYICSNRDEHPSGGCQLIHQRLWNDWCCGTNVNGIVRA